MDAVADDAVAARVGGVRVGAASAETVVSVPASPADRNARVRRVRYFVVRNGRGLREADEDADGSVVLGTDARHDVLLDGVVDCAVGRGRHRRPSRELAELNRAARDVLEPIGRHDVVLARALDRKGTGADEREHALLDEEALRRRERHGRRHPRHGVEAGLDVMHAGDVVAGLPRRAAFGRARAKPGGIGKRQAAKGDVVDGPVGRAARVHEGLEHRSDDRCRGHIFPGFRYVENIARALVEIPLARLVEQLVCVFEPFDRARRPSAAGGFLRQVGIGPARLIEREVGAGHRRNAAAHRAPLSVEDRFELRGRAVARELC